MINNLEKIKPLLRFETADRFYFLQILKRRKDNPGMTGDSKCIRNFYVYSIEELEALMPEIADLCFQNRARAYLRLNVRSAQQVALLALKKTADHLANGSVKHARDAYSSACGESHAEKRRESRWIVDLDSPGPGDIEHVERTVSELWAEAGVEGEFHAYLPTPSGLHIIASPFNREAFEKRMHGVDVHTDNPTVLYVPTFSPWPESHVWA